MLRTPRSTAWWMVGQQKIGFFRWIVSWAPSQVPPILSTTLRGWSGPTIHPEDSQIWRWKDYGLGSIHLTIHLTDLPGTSVSNNMVTWIVPTINRFLPPSIFPTTRGVRFFNKMELLVIPQVPLWSFSGGRRSSSFRDGQHSLQIWILLSISGEEWRRKLGGPSRRMKEELWDACKLAFNAIQVLRLCQTGWQLFCRPKEPIQDINYLTFSPWWNTWLILHLLFYLLFEKD